VKLNAYATRDSKADVYNKPFYMSTHGEAIRAFHSACKKEGSSLHEFPEDFNMYFLGTWDDQSGEFETCKPLHLASALDGRQAILTTQGPSQVRS